MRWNMPHLWRNANFARLWAGQTISLVGSNITILAIPLAAVSQLHATPTQMGILQMVQYLPFLLFGLLAGVWVDRLPRRPMLMLADAGRAVALTVVPIAAFNNWLSMDVLYGVVFVLGTFNLLFEAAYAAFLPQIVPISDLPGGNSTLQTSAAAAEIAGPGLGGWLIQLWSAAFALLADALSFLASAKDQLPDADVCPTRQSDTLCGLEEAHRFLPGVEWHWHIRPGIIALRAHKRRGAVSVRPAVAAGFDPADRGVSCG